MSEMKGKKIEKYLNCNFLCKCSVLLSFNLAINLFIIPKMEKQSYPNCILLIYDLSTTIITHKKEIIFTAWIQSKSFNLRINTKFKH